MRLTYIEPDNVFVFVGRYEDRQVAKDAGFRWDAQNKRWFTAEPKNALRLRQYSDRLALEVFARTIDAAIETSRATDASIDIPAPRGLQYRPFQKAGIAYSLARDATIIADEPGLGKTIQFLGVINTDPGKYAKGLLICPATLRINWKREADKWLVDKRPVYVIEGKNAQWPVAPTDAGPYLIIINYDILAAHRNTLASVEWDIMGCDEAHYLKNPNALRTIAVVGHEKRGEEPVPGLRARKKLFLTGTPIVNRPVEMWPILHYADRSNWKRFMEYAKRYCDAQHNGYGWDFRGASNHEELQRRLRASIMVRRLKADVLAELPPKVRQVIELPHNVPMGKLEKERAEWEKREAVLLELRAAADKAKTANNQDEYKRIIAKLREATKVAFEEMSSIRREAAILKLPYVVAYLREALEDDDSKVVVFAHHHEVIDAIAAAFPKESVVLDGRTSPTDKQAAVDAFQTNPKIRLFIGGILAAGVGITLTASNHVIFAELDWVPGNVTQAEDRCHRIGQLNSVLVQHLVLEGSVDCHIVRKIVEKQENIDRALDRKPAETQPVPIPPAPTPIPTPVTSAQPPIQLWLSKEDKELILRGLQSLAGVCDGARKLDGCGFNKLDAYFGQELASRNRLSDKQAQYGLKLVIKYQRQLPPDWVARYYQMRQAMQTAKAS